jgi:hypothetical protein
VFEISSTVLLIRMKGLYNHSGIETMNRMDRYDAKLVYRLFLGMHSSMCLWIFFQSLQAPVNIGFGVFVTCFAIQIGIIASQHPAAYNPVKTQEHSRIFIKSGGIVFVPIFIIFEILKYVQPAFKIIFSPVIVVMSWYQWRFYRNQFLGY